eukprot:scaffold118713_cov69-Phaeocystis_antarctica.AAC.2
MSAGQSMCGASFCASWRKSMWRRAEEFGLSTKILRSNRPVRILGAMFSGSLVAPMTSRLSANRSNRFAKCPTRATARTDSKVSHSSMKMTAGKGPANATSKSASMTWAPALPLGRSAAVNV